MASKVPPAMPAISGGQPAYKQAASGMTLTDLNKKNRETYKPTPLIQRDGQGKVVDEKFRR